MIIISRKIGDKEVSFIYNSKVDGPLEVYKRNPNFTIKEIIKKEKATPHQTDAGIPQEESKDAVLGQTSDSMDTEIPKHNPEVSPIVAKIV